MSEQKTKPVMQLTAALQENGHVGYSIRFNMAKGTVEGAGIIMGRMIAMMQRQLLMMADEVEKAQPGQGPVFLMAVEKAMRTEPLNPEGKSSLKFVEPPTIIVPKGRTE